MHMTTPTPTSIDSSSTTARMRWHVVAESDWLAAALAWVNRAAAAAIAAREEFHLVLAGGGTPETLYRALAGQAHDWARWHIWFGDERCLPRSDPQRNSQMAASAWLDRVAIPASQIHIIPAELGAEAAATAYARELSGGATFDLVLLGLGQDGHTASLFPDHNWGNDNVTPDAMAVLNAPKPPSQRVTLSARRLSQTHQVLYLIRGIDKRDALTRWRDGAAIPAAAVQPDCGVDLLIDMNACPPGEPK